MAINFFVFIPIDSPDVTFHFMLSLLKCTAFQGRRYYVTVMQPIILYWRKSKLAKKVDVLQ